MFSSSPWLQARAPHPDARAPVSSVCNPDWEILQRVVLHVACYMLCVYVCVFFFFFLCNGLSKWTQITGLVELSSSPPVQQIRPDGLQTHLLRAGLHQEPILPAQWAGKHLHTRWVHQQQNCITSRICALSQPEWRNLWRKCIASCLQQLNGFWASLNAVTMYVNTWKMFTDIKTVHAYYTLPNTTLTFKMNATRRDWAERAVLMFNSTLDSACWFKHFKQGWTMWRKHHIAILSL